MKKIGIAGVGGIGSNVAVHLVRAGIPELVFADFDRIDASNLNRQFYFADQIGQDKASTLAVNLKRINPALRLAFETIRLEAAGLARLFADCTVVVEGFDKKESKKVLIETCAALGKTVVSANGVAGTDLGRVSIRKLGSLWMVGDFATDVAELGTFSPKVGLIAALMSALALEAIR